MGSTDIFLSHHILVWLLDMNLKVSHTTLFLSSPCLCLIIVRNCELFVYKDIFDELEGIHANRTTY